ncbi:hypothetical protein GCM10010123_07820 [Pilimelia anulata]|uniref:Uncharacterized protein n=1 Tax=Pilimelia anulata TaxID=53371 RepID=A0A8J3F7V1_9ACTN|nr:DUF6401 family natural product biosynthesis protein [Pilimelia anulata]GGJ80302.1 hypothetical protein GCM10010123_07820 [Pilimelia anulata]
MTSEYLRTAESPAPCVRSLGRARDALDDLMARVGVDGLTHALADPAGLARLDQHAADVREAVHDAGRRLGPEALASYAASVTAAAQRMGLFLPEPGEAAPAHLDWARAPWHLLRLTAVCAIAEEAGWL